MPEFDINEGKDLMHLEDDFKESSEVLIVQKCSVFEGKFVINIPCSFCQEDLKLYQLRFIKSINAPHVINKLGINWDEVVELSLVII